MKNVCIFFLLSIIISLTALGISAPQTTPNASDYLRMHIRANSNATCDQDVKYAVKDEIVSALTPVVATCESKEQAVQKMRLQTGYIQVLATRFLQSKGFAYGARAEVRTEKFPTRVYENYTLPAGEYVSLIVELGEGKGDNWWCVVYPPLCFTTRQTPVVYKSKIVEIIEKWKKG